MARKVKAPTAEADPGADDLQVLNPERSAVIAGRAVTVREYGFIEGLRLKAQLQPFLDDLNVRESTGEPIGLPALVELFAAHVDSMQPLLAIAADVEPEWIASLGHQDGCQLLGLWWLANSPFCWLNVEIRRQVQKAAAAAHAGQTSMPPSSPQATEAPATSAA